MLSLRTLRKFNFSPLEITPGPTVQDFLEKFLYGGGPCGVTKFLCNNGPLAGAIDPPSDAPRLP